MTGHAAAFEARTHPQTLQGRSCVMSLDHPMSKRTVTRLFVGGSVAFAVGLVLVLVALWAAVSSNWAVTAALVAVCALATIAGAVAGVVSWIGALLNTWKLDDKLWFASLLVLGLFGCGVLAMVAYVFNGPDGTAGAGFAASLAQEVH